jgi:hypothetical protein
MAPKPPKPWRGVCTNSRRLSAYHDPSSQLGRLTLRGDTYRKNERHCSETEIAVAKGEESQRVLNVLIVKAQESIEASRALISKLDGILRIKRGGRGGAPE